MHYYTDSLKNFKSIMDIPYHSRLYKGMTATLVTLEMVIYTVSVVSGWHSLVYIFRDVNFFSHLCTNVTRREFNRSSQETFDLSISHGCPEQEEMLNLVYTVANCASVALPILGFVYDHCGSVCVRFISIFLSVGGALLMSFSNPGTEWLLFPGTIFHHMGGVMFITTNVKSPLLFPKKIRATLRSTWTGSANISGFSFLAVKLAYDNGIDYRWSLIFFASITLIIAVPTTFFLPPRHYESGNQDNNNENTDTKSDQTNNEFKTETGCSDNEVHGTTMSFGTILKQPIYWWTQLWFSGNVLLVILYFGSFNSIVDFRSGRDIERVSLYTNVAGYVQLVLSVPASALIGFIVDREQKSDMTHAEPKTFIPALLITSMSGLLVWVLCAIPVLEVQFAAMVFNATLSSATYGVFTAFIPFAFPIKHFGKVYTKQRGMMAIFCGLQFPLFYWQKSHLESDPLYFSVAAIGISCLTFGLPLYLARGNKIHEIKPRILKLDSPTENICTESSTTHL